MATPIRRAAPSGASRSARPTRDAAPRGSSGYRGAEGMRKMQEEDERNQARREAARSGALMPFRFFCPAGETREVIIVDEQPDFFRYEHNLKDRRSGKWSIFTSCINEDANCPVCAVSERPAYFAMYLTIIDLTPFETEKSGYVEWSKKLLVVKSMQQKKFTRLLERHGTLRGMRISLTRDSDKDAGIGNDIEFIEFVPEEELETYVSEFETERDGKTEVREVLGYEVFDYDELFPAQTEQELRAIAGTGHRHEDDRDDGRDYERGARGRSSSRPAARPASRAPARPSREAPPARGGRDDARPARGRRDDPPDDNPDDAADAGHDDQPQRRAPPARASLRQPPARPAARGRREEDDQPPEDDAPQRGGSLADRRRMLRRP